MNATERIWLDWSAPCLPAAAQWIIEHLGRSNDPGDLSGVHCLLPGRRAGRQLLHLLAEECGRRGRCLHPPRTMTPGCLVEYVTGAGGAIATEVERRLAWVEALRRGDASELQPLMAVAPEGSNFAAWHDLAGTITSMLDDLAGGRVQIGDVADHAERVEGLFAEAERWRALQSIHRRYLELLDACDLVDAHIAREQALARGIERDRIPHAPEAFVLVGTNDLNALQRAIVGALPVPTYALVHAPEGRASAFDDLGMLVPDEWMSDRIALDEGCIEVCDRPADQAQAVFRRIARFGGRYAAPQITIGVGDESLAGRFRRDADWAGLSLHAPTGVELARTAPYRLLEAVADWLEDERFATFATLVRHPDLERWLQAHLDDDGRTGRGIASWLNLLDRYFTDHLHQHFSGEWLGDEGEKRSLRAVHGVVCGWLADLHGDARPLSDWAEAILGILRTVYGHEADESAAWDSNTIDACLRLRDILARLPDIHPALQPTLDATDAIAYLLEEARDERLPAEATEDQIEMLGWLELNLDVAPALIITGFNDGSIPEAVHGDAFLPDALRRRLGLMHNARRYARDAYLLQAITHSTADLAIITGRRAQDGEPLVPSRLLMACDDETVKRRIEVFCDEDEDRVIPPPIGAPSPAAESAFEVPPLPTDLAAPEKMSVTDFKLYLQCPYRYALRRLLKLEAVSDEADELDPLQFGWLAHKVLETFGRDESIRDADEGPKIERFLREAMNDLAKRRYGAKPMPSVRVQLARLERRLAGFAECQASMRREGWKIEECEWKFGEDSALDIPGGDPMPISGKIDRIDRHEETGRWRIIDYKTGDNPAEPDVAHVGRSKFDADEALEWLDLQLPLYRFLAQQREITGDVELAYILLPRLPEGVRLVPAHWSPGQLEAALEEAREVVRRIRCGAFEINPEFDSRYDDFRRICQTTVFTSTGAAAPAGEATA